jgi:uncharacterized protein DUF5343
LPLTDAYVQTYGQLAELFRQIRQGQAPDQFTVQHLKDLGFTSSNHRLFLPLLKALGFLTADGKPTPRYHEYRDESQSKRIMTEALREAYGDLFVLRARPSDADKALIEGKFKSTHNTSDRMAKLMASTFYSLLQLADLDVVPSKAAIPSIAELPSSEERHGEELSIKHNSAGVSTSLHYNIQIHLPATKDIEVYNAISNP